MLNVTASEKATTTSINHSKFRIPITPKPVFHPPTFFIQESLCRLNKIGNQSFKEFSPHHSLLKNWLNGHCSPTEICYLICTLLMAFQGPDPQTFLISFEQGSFSISPYFPAMTFLHKLSLFQKMSQPLSQQSFIEH